MKASDREYFKRLSQLDLSQEFNCLNAMQNTPWRINNPVLEVMRWAWDNDQQIGGLANKHDLPLEPYPFDKEPRALSDQEREAFLAWRARRATVHTENHRSMSKRLQNERTIALAETYAKYNEFYFVWQNDFRGRKYTVESFLSPQVADWGKALITFAKGMTIETDEEAEWLAIHGANLFGVDKVSLLDRQIWAYMNEDNIARTVENPYEYRWWCEADKPWQALAWCYEWYGYLVEGKGFVTTLPCHADGTCNGLQHLSAILRDERGGAAINLTPSPKPQDIYTDVAKTTITKLQADAAQGHALAAALLEFGIDRKITKRSVMIVPYSGTLMACREYILEAMEERIAKGHPKPWPDLFEASMYLSKHVWAAIQEVIQSASRVMDYLRTVGSHCAKQNKPMEWTTPTGLLVRQVYNDTKIRKIKTHLNGSITFLTLHEPIEDKIDSHRTRNGSSPNFIHSMDAAALTKTINRCTEEGIVDFAMVHDSYGTHSPSMPRMSRILREEFVKLYENNDVLRQLKDHVESYTEGDLPEPPEKGELDLKKVLESPYFFS